MLKKEIQNCLTFSLATTLGHFMYWYPISPASDQSSSKVDCKQQLYYLLSKKENNNLIYKKYSLLVIICVW